MAHNVVALHVPKQVRCVLGCVLGRHLHCYRPECNRVLFSGEKVAKFRNGGKAIVTKKGLAKYFCLDCGRLLADSTVRK